MKLTSKQRAYLRGIAHGLDAICLVGKAGVSPELVKSLDEALEARELVKAGILDNCPVDVAEAAQTAGERTRSAVVQVIGGKFVLYRPSKKPIIQLPR